MAHRLTSLRLARRLRQQAAKRTESGLALAAARLNEKGFIDQNQQMLVLPVSIAYAADALSFLNWEQYPAPFEAARKVFINRLACHPDARLRAAAADADVLTDDVVRELAQDSAFAVRQALARNNAALCKLSGQCCAELAKDDETLAIDALNTLERLALRENRRLNALPENDGTETSSNVSSEGNALSVINALRAVADRFLRHPDYEVRAAAKEALEALEPEEASSRGQMLWNKRRKMTPPSSHAFFGNPGEDAYGFIFLDDIEVNADGTALPKENLPIFLLPVDALNALIGDLPNNPTAQKILECLSRNGSNRVREAAAQLAFLPKAAIDVLKKDAAYNVRLALLQNESVLTELTDEEVLHLIRNDASIIRDAFAYADVGARLSRILHDAFDDTEDPGISELLAAIGD